ncbi:DUF6624 domain-containing protein [Streptomyces mirabilis]|uniref:DUF6624 domain-containing protein n=1 Tax=Streptomyces mirabilis TaxID=68239 RepID=UPI00369CE0ED
MTHYDQELARELVAMAEADQAMRNRALETGVWDAAMDARHTTRLKEIITCHGWPTVSLVGPEAASAAWLLAQHADHDPDFQGRCLALMQQLPIGEVSPAHLAYLEDRVRVNTGRPQRYGTQFHGGGATFRPRPIEDLEQLDTRRHSVGLPPFAQYQEQLARRDKQHQEAIQQPDGRQ